MVPTCARRSVFHGAVATAVQQSFQVRLWGCGTFRPWPYRFPAINLQREFAMVCAHCAILWLYPSRPAPIHA